MTTYVVGHAITQGSFDPSRHGGFLQAKKDELEAWRDRIARVVERHRGRDAPCLEGTFAVSLIFVAKRRVSPKYRKRWWPRGQEGDVDKLTRAVLDALGVLHRTDKDSGIKYTIGAQVYRNDNAVVHVTAGKVYAETGDDEGGMLVRVWMLDPALEAEGWCPVPSWPGWRYVHRRDLLSL